MLSLSYNVCSMNEQLSQEDLFKIIKEIESTPDITQRSLSERLSFSLGKTNYLLKSLIKRGTISVKHFTERKGKLGKVKYMLTKKGFDERLQLTAHFLQRKEAEYLQIKSEWELLNGKNETNHSDNTSNLNEEIEK